MNAFINDLSTFLPGQAVDNNSIDKYLGRVDRISARTRKMILASNGIEKRHYAIHPETGAATHTNAQLAAEAVRGLRLWQETPSPFFKLFVISFCIILLVLNLFYFASICLHLS